MNTVRARATPRRRSFQHIESLDGVRGIAVLTVVFHHLAFTSLTPGNWSPIVSGFARVFRDGALGVDLFFVLSGYLITTLLLIDRRDPNGYWNFYVKRCFRIVPVLVVSLLVGRISGFLDNETVVLSLVFLANYSRLLHVPNLGGYWSLSVEEQFYLFWPTVIRNLRFRTFLRLVAGIILIEPFVRFAMNAKGHGTAYFTFVRCDGLAWGAMLGASAYYGRIYTDPQRAHRWWVRYGRWFAIVGATLTFAMVAFLSLHGVGAQETTILLTVVPLGFAGLVAYLIAHPASKRAYPFRLPILRFFGDISYALYLFHLNVMSIYDRVRPLRPGDDVGYFIRIIVVFSVSSLLCALSLTYFERPIMRLRTRYLRPAGKVRRRARKPRSNGRSRPA